jgi:hypothetical protein
VSVLVGVDFAHQRSLKMEALLSICTVVEEPAVAHYFCGQKVLKHLKFIGEF